MALVFFVYAALFVIGVWFAYRSGQLHERARASRERQQKLRNYAEGRSIYDNGSGHDN